MHFVRAHANKKPTQISVMTASLYVALFFVVAATAQLFAFEDFPDVINSYELPLDPALALPLAAAIVSLEVLAIPSLLWMKMSSLMLLLSRLSGWLALVYWLLIGIWQSTVDLYIPNAGMFGAKVMMPQGWWLVSYCAILLVLLAYATWGSWLTRSRAK